MDGHHTGNCLKITVELADILSFQKEYKGIIEERDIIMKNKTNKKNNLSNVFQIKFSTTCDFLQN